MVFDLTIAIVNWNTRDYLRACLRSISDNVKGMRYEVIIADNASRDGSAAMVQEEFPEFTLIENKRNICYAKANNRIFEASRGRNVLLLNPDTLILGEAVETMSRSLDAEPDAAAAAPQFLNPDGTFQHYYQRLPTFVTMLFKLTYLGKFFPQSAFIRDYYMLDDDFAQVRELEQPAACCLMIKKSLRKGYLFDERFPLLWNDVDLCKRIRDEGYTIRYVPQARVIHHKGTTGRIFNMDFNPEYYGAVFLYFRKHRGFLPFCLLWVIIVLNQLVYCSVSLIKFIGGRNTSGQFKSDLALLSSFISRRQNPDWAAEAKEPV
jgi:N-acetylglucosaminyl-diphospho-decaprenol L-rhamnosyltransferase